MNKKTPARQYTKGMGEAVANRTINRKIRRKLKIPETLLVKLTKREDISLDHQVEEYCLSKGFVIQEYSYKVIEDNVLVTLNILEKDDVEHWGDVAKRVSYGNTCLNLKDQEEEYPKMLHHLRQASLLMSGRHLQHGDETQPQRNQEIFTNCATAATSFLSFYLLLNGSGVGRAYDNDLMLVDWKNLPILITTIDRNHSDVVGGEISCLDKATAEHLYASKKIHHFEVEDSREGWAKAIEEIELKTFNSKYRNDVLLIDFSKVRGKGSPIGGMQNRPASGPGPLITAINNLAKLRDSGMAPWRATMYVDHYLAECVLVGGARRAARMATKDWKDTDVLDFVAIKRGGFLWSANNSLTVTEEFWKGLDSGEDTWAEEVFEAITKCSYYDGTGEPGLINQDKLVQNDLGLQEYIQGDFIGSKKYPLTKETSALISALAKVVLNKEFYHIVNPCGEISLMLMGGYCVIADVVPYHAKDDDDAEEAFRVATRALLRVNTMDSLYKKEVLRTNRIGVGITGFHEWAWTRFGFGWKDLIDEKKSLSLWLTLSRFKRAVKEESEKYSLKLGVSTPHTDTTIKPAGTTSKLFGLTEGAHLPSMREFLRWVQFRNDDPLVEEYRKKGYPVRVLQSYHGTTIVGFPTQPEICKLQMKNKLVTAAEATPEEQYKYLQLLEKYWIQGVSEDGVTPLEDTGNQVSYTLKYAPEKVSFSEFQRTLREGQATIRCCSVMPQSDATAYEYQPEEPVTKAKYQQIAQEIVEEHVQEDIGIEHVDCGGGACPIDFKSDKE